MRSAILIALSATFALLVAAQAGATSSVDLIYLDGSSVVDQASCSGDEGCVQAAPGDTVRFAVTMDIDVGGLTAFGFDLLWDTDGEDELDLVVVKQRASLVFLTPNPSPPPDTLSLGEYNVLPIEAPVESPPGNFGHVYNFAGVSTTVTGPFIASTSFRIGVVGFHVNVNESPGANIELTFLRTDGSSAMGNSLFQFITPNFGNGTVRVPEPGMTMLILAGLSALGLLALRGRRD